MPAIWVFNLTKGPWNEIESSPSLSCVSSHSLDSLAKQEVDGVEPFVGLFYVILVSLQGCFHVFIGMSLTCYTTSFIGIWCESFTLFHFSFNKSFTVTD